jgi:hypothetical protein
VGAGGCKTTSNHSLSFGAAQWAPAALLSAHCDPGRCAGRRSSQNVRGWPGRQARQVVQDHGEQGESLTVGCARALRSAWAAILERPPAWGAGSSNPGSWGALLQATNEINKATAGSSFQGPGHRLGTAEEGGARRAKPQGQQLLNTGDPPPSGGAAAAAAARRAGAPSPPPRLGIPDVPAQQPTPQRVAAATEFDGFTAVMGESQAPTGGFRVEVLTLNPKPCRSRGGSMLACASLAAPLWLRQASSRRQQTPDTSRLPSHTRRAPLAPPRRHRRGPGHNEAG